MCCWHLRDNFQSHLSAAASKEASRLLLRKVVARIDIILGFNTDQQLKNKVSDDNIDSCFLELL